MDMDAGVDPGCTALTTMHGEAAISRVPDICVGVGLMH